MVAVESAPPSGGEDKSFGCVRLRGLPFTSTYQDILQFFEAYTVVDVLITKTGGKPNGQGYVLLSSQAESQQACVELNNKFMGKRYIEVFSSTVADMETARRMSEDRPKVSTPRQQDLLFPMGSQQQQQQPGGHLAQHSSAMCQLPGLLEPLMQLSLADHSRSSAFTNSNSSNSNTYITSGNAASANQQLQFNLQQLTQQQQQQQTQLVHIIRLRGLPFSSTEADVAAFLAPIELPGGGSAIRLARHPDLRPTGEAYVTLRSEAEVMMALKKHKSMMGKRYIEVFPSCFAEMQQGLHQQLAPPPPPVGGPLIFTPPSMSSAGAMSAANYMKSLLPNNSPLLAPMGPPPACNLQQQLTQQQLLLAALQQQQQQQQGLAIRPQAATLTQNYIPGSMQQIQMQGVQMQGMPGAGSGLACFTPNPNPGMASLLAQQQQQQAVTAALAATVLPSMPLVPAASACGVSSGSFAGLGDSLSMAQLDTSAAVAASIAASTSGMASSDMHYVPYYSNSVVASVAQHQQQQQQQLLQSASMAQLMSPTCSTGGSFAQIVSSAGLDMLSSSSGCLDSSTTGVMPVAAAAAAAAAAAVCNEPLPLDGCGGARQGGSAGVFL